MKEITSLQAIENFSKLTELTPVSITQTASRSGRDQSPVLNYIDPCRRARKVCFELAMKQGGEFVEFGFPVEESLAPPVVTVTIGAKVYKLTEAGRWELNCRWTTAYAELMERGKKCFFGPGGMHERENADYWAAHENEEAKKRLTAELQELNFWLDP